MPLSEAEELELLELELEATKQQKDKYPSAVPADGRGFTPDEENLKPKFSFQLPMPQKATGGEAVAQEIAGATLGSMAMPQVAVPKLLNQAPGLIKSMAANVPKIMGAGGGAGAAGGDPVEAMKGEATGVVAINALQKVFSPFKGRLTDEAKELIKFSRDNKIPISPSSLNPGLTAKAMQGGADWLLPGRLVNRAFRNKMVTRFNDLIAKETSAAPGRDIAADVVQDEFGNIVKGLRGKAKSSADKFIGSLPEGGDTGIAINGTKAKLLDIKRNFKQKGIKDFVDAELSATSGTIKTADELDTLYKEIGQIKGVRGKAKLALDELKTAIEQDFKASGADLSLFKKSNQDFAKSFKLTSNKVLKDLADGVTHPKALTVRVFSASNPNAIDNIKKLKGTLSPEVWEQLKAQNIANLIDNFSTASTQLPGVKVITKGEKLADWVADNRKVLEAAYTPEQVKALENFSKLAKAAKVDISKFEKDLTGLATFNTALAGGGIFAGMDASLIVAGGGSIPMAFSMMNPNGVLNKWLTTGLQVNRPTQEALRLGGRAVFQNGAE